MPLLNTALTTSEQHRIFGSPKLRSGNFGASLSQVVSAVMEALRSRGRRQFILSPAETPWLRKQLTVSTLLECCTQIPGYVLSRMQSSLQAMLSFTIGGTLLYR